MGRRPPGDRLTAVSRPATRRLTLAAAALSALTGAVGCSVTGPAPAVTREPTLAAVSAGSGTLLTPAGTDSDTLKEWLARLDWAAATLAQAGLDPLADGWDGSLLIELPATGESYAALAGAGAATAAAVTSCPEAGARITVNPVVADEDPDYLDSLVLHEGVHVATGSSCEGGRAAQWVEEGLAEWLACEHSAAALDANQQWVSSYLEQHGVPTRLPADSDFHGSSDTVSAAYGLARQAVASAVDRLGRPAAMALLGSHYRGTADAASTRRLTGWYLADLARLSGSAAR